MAAGLPYRSVAVFGLTFLVETVDLGDLSRLVVSADESDAVRESISISTVNVVLVCQLTYFAFKHMRRVKVSRLKYPRSTKSPKKMKFCWPFPPTVFLVESASDAEPRLRLS